MTGNVVPYILLELLGQLYEKKPRGKTGNNCKILMQQTSWKKLAS